MHDDAGHIMELIEAGASGYLLKYVPEYVPSITPKIIWASKILAIWFSATLVYGCYEYFRQYKIRREWVLLKNAWRERRLTR